MKIEFNDQGSDSVITLTSTVFKFRLHNRAVDTALFLAPSVRAKRSGFFVLKTIITGKTSHVLLAYKAIKAEASR
ncbi:hypothetical protein [Klebsiella pneumoniae]|uniref:hypothetical protein n=1 Tax=Klebsiella pneumoniae TaxID=573 RepID=UPI000807C593|nr:hypothetical protein [Klebsiella pneumoniae]MCE0418688.1 hypothetical protein [Klebsiella pneumoniae]THT68171.1 hypothetical protein FAU04_06860 [Klebsiella pneumoniae subsp. pneumoniae]URB99459.1 hypothetical protein M8J65_21295 [Klebsiella pneumoniae]SBW72406.1 Uncharacterised protein [Klebsiella pneumoniae]HCE0100537.1 hypothetical protein [Klebsiella pneumoniae]